MPKQLEAPVGLADALFTTTQQRVLGCLFGQPDRSFFFTELIKLTGAGSGAVQRELEAVDRQRAAHDVARGQSEALPGQCAIADPRGTEQHRAQDLRTRGPAA
ncbi:hypothetical protein [Variovorax sp. UC122_21]|uniref:hypothetical protein n=1 Tax=Variovorax sp. UC122_21 TaxID=3374554 RepID=UPI0037563C2B